VRRFDVARGAFQRLAYGRGERFGRASAHVGGDRDRAELHAIELARDGAERRIATRRDALEEDAHRVSHPRIVRRSASMEERPPISRRERPERAREPHTEGRTRCGHGVSLSIRVTRIPSQPSSFNAPMVR